jgi:1-acyl-sn-glycerol-3-phosphate acyltransferase
MHFLRESKSPVKTARLGAEGSLGWLLYFFFTIGVIGGVMTFMFYLPLTLVSFIFPKVKRAADYCLKTGVRFLLFSQPWLDLKSNIQDPERKTKPGTLLVGNHRSTLDVYLLLASVSGIQIFTNRKLLVAFPLIPMLLMSRQILVKDGDPRAFLDGMKTVRDRLKGGETVYVFPELTRCSPGMKGTNGFTVAPFLAAFQEKSPVLPIVIKGTDDVWPRGRFGLAYRAPVEIRSLEPIDSSQFASADALRTEVRKRIDEALA